MVNYFPFNYLLLFGWAMKYIDDESQVCHCNLRNLQISKEELE
jgi:hypothetical protein